LRFQPDVLLYLVPRSVFFRLNFSISNIRRSQWSRGLSHELSSLGQKLGSWVRIPFEAWMSVCIYSVFVLGSGLATGLSLAQGFLPNVLD
jgi:hypothetical protein